MLKEIIFVFLGTFLLGFWEVEADYTSDCVVPAPGKSQFAFLNNFEIGHILTSDLDFAITRSKCQF